MHVAAFEQAQIGFKKARELTDGLFDELVMKGEILESKAGVTLKGTRAKFLQRYAETTETNAKRDFEIIEKNTRQEEDYCKEDSG